MSANLDTNELPFDQVSRQRIVKDCIDKLRIKSNESFSILDAGGHRGLTVQFQSQDKITILDVYDESYEGYIKGNACDMSFNDDSFDFVVSFDVLEHIPKKDRNNFLNECARVAKKGVFIAAPNSTKFNQSAEKSLNDLYFSLHGKEHEWLHEHIAYGLPNYSNVVTAFTERGLHTLTAGSNSSDVWLSMQGAILNATKFGDALKPLAVLNSEYNKQLYYDGEKNGSKNYRMICIALKKEQDKATISKHLSHLTYIDDIKKTNIISSINNYYSETLGMMNEKILKQHSELKKADGDIRNCLAIINDLEKRLNKKEKSIITRARSRLSAIKKSTSK